MDNIDASAIPDEYDSILTIQLFNYLIVFDNQWNNVFAHSFDFESDEECETFGYRFSKNNIPKVFELHFITDLIQKHLKRIANKEIKEENFFIDLYLPPYYVCLLQMHGLYFIAVYAENDKKYSPVQKEFIQGSLRGIASAYIAACNPEDINPSSLSEEGMESFLNAIPVIIYQTDTEEKSRNCALCQPEKNCIPKLLVKNMHPY